MNKKGQIIESTLICLIAVLVFFSVLFLFIYTKSSNTALLEEKTAKEIALMLDSARAGTHIILNVDDVIKKNSGVAQPILITGNYVTVKLSGGEERKGYTYSFFSKLNVKSNIAKDENGRDYLFLDVK